MASYGIKQYVFSSKNIPPSGNILESDKVIRLGIQTMPGVKFLINSDDKESAKIQIGRTGIYQIDLSSLGYITSLIIDSDSINTVKENYCYIDIIYEKASEIKEGE